MSTPDTCPELEGWLTLPAVADALGVSRAWVHEAAKRDFIDSLRRVGDQPLLIMREAELPSLRKRLKDLKPGRPPGRKADDEANVVPQDRASA